MTAQPSAAPMNGAVQGAAAAIAKTPEKNAPARPCFAESFSPSPIQRAPNSKYPSSAAPAKKNSAASAPTTHGDWS